MPPYLALIESLLRDIVRHGGWELSFSIAPRKPDEGGTEGKDFVVDFSGPDTALLLEKNGTLLDALEYLVLKAARVDEEHFGRISFDCQDWRWVRSQELRLAAQVAAERVIQTGDPFPLNPMNARERRIVHLALKDQPQVRTLSEGYGAHRKVVIHPAERAPCG